MRGFQKAQSEPRMELVIPEAMLPWDNYPRFPLRSSKEEVDANILPCLWILNNGEVGVSIQGICIHNPAYEAGRLAFDLVRNS